MKKSRIEKTSITLYLFLLGIFCLISAGFAAIMYPNDLNYAYGILCSSGILILFSFIFNPRMLKDIVTSRRSWLLVNDLILVCLIIGIGVMLTYVSSRRHYRYDFTREKMFSLSEQTTKVLGNLKKEVKITAFFQKGALDGQMIEDLMSEYKNYSGKIQFKVVDPFRDPISTKAMNIRTAGTVVVQCDTNRKDILPDEMFITSSPYMRQTNREKPKFQGEQAVTSAIINVTSGPKRKVMFVSGHDEASTEVFKQDGLAGLQQFLVKENFEVVESPLTEGIATDVSVLVVADPKTNYHPAEIDQIRKFVFDRRGNLCVALDPKDGLDDLKAFFNKEFGIFFNNEVLINEKPIFQDVTMVTPYYENHPIVKILMEKHLGILFQFSGSLSLDKKPIWDYVEFLKTPSTIFAKKLSSQLYSGNIQFDPSTDVKANHAIGVALTGKGNASGTRAVFFSDGNYMTNNFLRVQANGDLMINTVNWLAGQEELISIRPKSLDIPQLDPGKLDQEGKNRIFIICTLLSPMMVVFLGGMVWFTRRRV